MKKLLESNGFEIVADGLSPEDARGEYQELFEQASKDYGTAELFHVELWGSIPDIDLKGILSKIVLAALEPTGFKDSSGSDEIYATKKTEVGIVTLHRHSDEYGGFNVMFPVLVLPNVTTEASKKIVDAYIQTYHEIRELVGKALA